jgi:hypothetical protein
MGNILKQGPRVHRLIIHKKEHIELIILLFNGNIILPTRKIQFHKFITAYNNKNNNSTIEYISSHLLPSLDNEWITGFTEAEGCFTISLLKNSLAFHTRFILSQKGDINLPILSSFISLFNIGRLEGHSIKDNYNYIVTGLNNMKAIYNYFDNNPLKGIKLNSYLAFKDLNNR